MLLDPSDVPGVVGDTGTSRGAGRTSELLGLGLGTTLIGGGGSCATAPLADESSIVSAMTLARFAFMAISLFLRTIQAAI